jgi:hypothetical protein
MPAAPLEQVRRARRRTRTTLVIVTALTLLGCTADPDDRATSTPSSSRSSAAPTEAEDYDLTGLPLPRAPFCDVLDEAETRTALGGAVTGTAHYDNGDRTEITPGYVDVAHEYNCTFAGQAPASARAWVFARPVEPAEARRLGRQAGSQDGCEPLEEPRFGTPGGSSVCVAPRSGRWHRVTMSGLFTDTWFSCQLTRARAGQARVGQPELVALTEQWCVSVVTTLGARP